MTAAKDRSWMKYYLSDEKLLAFARWREGVEAVRVGRFRDIPKHVFMYVMEMYEHLKFADPESWANNVVFALRQDYSILQIIVLMDEGAWENVGLHPLP